MNKNNLNLLEGRNGIGEVNLSLPENLACQGRKFMNEETGKGSTNPRGWYVPSGRSCS